MQFPRSTSHDLDPDIFQTDPTKVSLWAFHQMATWCWNFVSTEIEPPLIQQKGVHQTTTGKIKQSFSLFLFFKLQQENRNSSTNTSRLIFFHFKYQSTIPIYVLGKWKKIRVNTGAFFGNFLQLNTSEWPYFIKSKL